MKKHYTSSDGKQTLDFVRNATRNDFPSTGYIYIHHWPTGWQELVFDNEEHLNSFIFGMEKKIEDEVLVKFDK